MQASVFVEGLKGISDWHDVHPRSVAPMHSTGNLVFSPLNEGPADFTKLYQWFIEYKCELCHELAYQSDPEHYDTVRAALKDNGYLPR